MDENIKKIEKELEEIKRFLDLRRSFVSKHGRLNKRKMIAECSVDGCSEPNHALGYCAKHHYKYKRYGDPLASATKEKKTCIYCGDTKVVAKGLCMTHYQRQRRLKMKTEN